MDRRSRRALAAVAAALIVGSITVLASPAYAATQTWTGQATSPNVGLWSADANWSGVAPVLNDSVVFTDPIVSIASKATNNDLVGNPALASVTFSGTGYSVSGNPINTVSVTQTGAFSNEISSGLTSTLLGANIAVSVAGGTLTSGPVTGGVNLTKTGAGVLILTGVNNYTGATTINGGGLIVNGTSGSSAHALTVGVLGGVGTVGPLTATGGAVSPGPAGGPGLLTVNGALSMTGGSYAVDINGGAAGSGHDVLRATSVTLGGGAQLVVSSNFTGALNQTFTIIDNTGAGLVAGQFLNLAEGATVTATGGQTYRISYIGGGGNDVVLTQIGQGGKTAQVLAGVDRVDTAVKISQNSFPANGSAQAVVLARGDLFPDALAGAPLAVNKQGPLLLANLVAGVTTVDARTVAEIQRVLTTGKTIFVLGGATAIPDSMVQQLTALGYVVPRQFAGIDRFQTAVLIAQTGLNNPANLFLANGINFPDALSGGPAAAKLGGAILLTNANVMPTFTSQYLASRTGATIFALGGPAAATGAAPVGNQIVGADRYATAVGVAQRFFPGPTAVGVASGEAFPDGLTGGAHIGKLGGPLLLTAQAALPANVQSYLQSVKATITQLFVYGGSNAVSASVVTSINAAVA